ncbi:MAG: YicC family protein [Selenomonadaceae bacterium]|nr:YicC family protein [Selenomonadaceae bacterium]
MTGFGAAETENESYKVHVEVKSVNQRFLDLAFHMPRLLNVWEDELRNRIKEKAARGKMDVYVTLVDKREMEACVRVNHGLAKGYHGALNEISDLLHLPRNGDVTAIAAYPDVLVMEERTSLEGCEEVLFPALEQALESLDAMRQREGMNIQQDFQQRLAELESMVDKVSALAPEIVEAYRQRLQKMMAELLADKDFDETRIIQETALYADKVNYTEEIVRLKSHFQQFRQMVAAAEGPVGRKLDFLIQEMNREANTIGSKANNAAAAQIVVDIKSEIEKLREQVQNIE